MSLFPATAEFYAAGKTSRQLLDEANSVVEMSTDFLTNSLAMRKRMYYIMVELACIHEQIRSSLVRRAQLMEEGEQIHDSLAHLNEEGAGAGLDTLVP